MKDIQKELMAGTFECPLYDCHLMQCGDSPRHTYSGPALISQDVDKRIRLRLFSPGMSPVEFFRKQDFDLLAPGQLIPDSGYYDFQGIDRHGRTWTAKRFRLNTDFSEHITYVQAFPRMLEIEFPKFEYHHKQGIHLFVAVDPNFPWHDFTTYADGRMVRDVFAHTNERFSWNVKNAEDGSGVWIKFESDGDLEDQSLVLMRGLSILSGRSLRPTVEEIRQPEIKKIRIHNRLADVDKSKILSAMNLRGPQQATDAHAFIKNYLLHSSSDTKAAEHCRLIYQYWHRILRARESDMENSALVLSVAVEGLISEVYSSEKFVDPAFIAEIDHAKPLIKKAGLKNRALGCVMSSLGNACKPRVQDVIRRFIEVGSLRKDHLTAWQALRNSAAHGESLSDDPRPLQQHINQFHICLDLYYRIVMQIIGYRGKFVDYSVANWPEKDFVPCPHDKLFESNDTDEGGVLSTGNA